ncbi:MAG TPA: sulfotransferase [Jatrophihabitans sp.]|nr:sulfotransferase [Jatrophihabitans sp.]
MFARAPHRAPRPNAFEPDAFEYVFVVTYGRSGSTLVQGLLNTLPHTLVRGENNLYILGLFRAQALARTFKRKYEKFSEPPSSAFYGLREMDLAAFAESAGELTTRQLLGSVPADRLRRIGFKEVLWHRIKPGETKSFFNFFEQAFPNAKYVLNQRDHEQVLGSGFWQKQDADEGKQALLRVEEIQAFLRETRPERTFDIRYEVLTGDDPAAAEAQLRGLAQFVTGSCDAALLARLHETMKRGHGPNPFGKSRGRAKKVTS